VVRMAGLANSPTQTLARWLITQEASEGPEGANPSAFRVCEKLRRSLSTLAGSAGYRSLISRASTLAQKEAPSLRAIRVNEDGSLEYASTREPPLNADECQRDGVLLVAHLLELLVSFIGPTLTLHLIRDVWPDAPFGATNS
jgi:hypothetical protein